MALFLAACGGGDSDDGLPKTVEDLRTAFSTSRSALCVYSSFFTNDTCRTFNPDTVFVMQEVETGSYNRWNLTVHYKGGLLFQENYRAGYSGSHGFLSTGEYFLQIDEQFKTGATPHLFVNGKKVEPLPPFTDDWSLRVREFGQGWLILESSAPYYIIGPRCAWMMYNIRTGEHKDYGRAECA